MPQTLILSLKYGTLSHSRKELRNIKTRGRTKSGTWGLLQYLYRQKAGRF